MAFRKKVGGSVNATETVRTQSLEKVPYIMLINDGADSVYIVLNQSPPTFHTSASTSDFELKSGESIVLDTLGDFDSFVYVCNIGETATVRFLGWH